MACGDDGEDGSSSATTTPGSVGPIEGGPRAFSKAFVRTLVDRDGEACTYMTSRAINQFVVVSREADCEAAVRAWPSVISRESEAIRPNELLAALNRAELVDRGQEARFKIPLRKKTELILDLLDSEAGWRVDSTLVTQLVVCRVGDEVGQGPGC